MALVANCVQGDGMNSRKKCPACFEATFGIGRRLLASRKYTRCPNCHSKVALKGRRAAFWLSNLSAVTIVPVAILILLGGSIKLSLVIIFVPFVFAQIIWSWRAILEVID